VNTLGPFPDPYTPPFQPHHRRLMLQAKKLLGDGESSLAVVVAQTACEVLTERMMARLTGLVDEPMQNWIRGRLRHMSDLDDHRVRTLYTALCGDHIETEPFWSDFKQHVDRRHGIVHQGLRVEPTAAQNSLDAVQRVLTHLEGVWNNLPRSQAT
jgi:hypothetical protein